VPALAGATLAPDALAVVAVTARPAISVAEAPTATS